MQQQHIVDYNSTAPTELTYFHPHGIHIYDPPTSELSSSLFVINHSPFGNAVEVFDVELAEESGAYSLVHQRTVRHPLFENINDVYAVC